MTDIADDAAALEAEHIARSLRRIDPSMPEGEAGECEECGEDMPRLVGGRCGFCRDGRRPPLIRFEERPLPSRRALRSELPAREETIPMSTQPASSDAQTIAVPCKGVVLAAVKARAKRDGESLGRSAAALIGDAIAAAAVDSAALKPRVDALGEADLEDLLAELRERMNLAVSVTDYDLAVERAEAAEAKIDRMRSLLSGAAEG